VLFPQVVGCQSNFLAASIRFYYHFLQVGSSNSDFLIIGSQAIAKAISTSLSRFRFHFGALHCGKNSTLESGIGAAQLSS